ncbi:MAG: glycosyltransferase family 1 protein [Anaerolineales bacterium]|nr:glycosyltransferase family 1 protein [Anaerolineales bacterium]
MRVTILTMGSRGDVQPYVALGAGLRRAGHAVTLATHREFETFIRRHGLEFAPVAGDPRAIVRSEAGQRFLEGGNNPLSFALGMFRIVDPLVEQVFRDGLAACAGADLILTSVLGVFAGYHIHQKTGQPLLPAYLQQLHATARYPAQVIPLLPAGPWSSFYNRLSYWLAEQAFWQLGRGAMNRARRVVLGLPPLPPRGMVDRTFIVRNPMLYGFSEHVLPRAPEWPANVHVTGYWFLERPAAWEPPAALRRFLAAGPPPVSIGFGSIVRRDPAGLTRRVLEALRLSGQRGLLLGGWGGLPDADLPETVLHVEAVPHDWLFPRMAAVIHHGGSGTTAAGLRAGVPSIVLPVFGDQPFWAWRVQALGVGPRPISEARLTARRLADAIGQAVADTGLRARAAALGEKIRAEDGVGRAVALIEDLARR